MRAAAGMGVAPTPSMQTLRLILVPIDGSAPSLAALDHAATLATDYDARIEVLHVIPERDPLSPAARAEIESAMNAAVEHAKATLGERVSFHTVVGDPTREIVEQAKQSVDLVVMGTHGRVGRLHSMLGSVAEGVVRNAPCPVLTVRDSSEGYQSFADRRHPRPALGDPVRHPTTSSLHEQHRGR